MSGFTRRARGLEQTFPMSGLQIHEPSDVSEYVQLVHPLFGPLQRIGSGERRTEGFAAAAGITLLTLSTAPAGVVRVIEFAFAEHDDPTARQISFHVALFAVTASEVCIQNSSFDGAAVAVPSLVNYPLHRKVILGPGDQLRVRAPVGGAFVIDGRTIFVDYSPADVA